MTDTNKKDNILEVSNPSEGVVVVYPKPGEEIVIDMELGSLERKIVGRDLVITTYSGGSIVVANYVVLFAQDNGLAVKDSTGLYYGIEDMLEEGSRAGFTGEELPKVVIDRELSSAGVNDTGEKYLQSSSSKLLEDVFSKDLLVGSVDIDTQNPVAELNPNLDPYEIRSLFLNNDKKLDTDVVYSFNGSTFFNQNQSYFKPVKVGSGSVDIVALYGAKTEDNSGKVVGLLGKVSELIYNGGGLIAGDIDVDLDRDLFGADYMWAAQEIDLSDREGGVFVNLLNKELFSDTFAESSDDWKSLINRKMSFKLTGSNVRIVDMFLTGLPEGVKIVESEGVEVFSGAGGALLRPKGTSSTLVVEFEYEEGFNEGDVVDANMVMSLNGYNSRTKTLIQVDNTFKLQFREVRSGADLINFSEVDAYTYSTGLDPKKIVTGEGGDFVVSGHGSNEYELGAGDDVFVSGKGVSVVDMGSGDDVYYAGLSGDIVDGGSGNNTIRIKGDVIEGVGDSVVSGLGIVDVFNNVAGKVLFGLASGSGFASSEVKLEFEGGVENSLKNFSNLYLSDKVNNIEVESTVRLTSGDNGMFNLYANEKVVSGVGSAKVVDFKDSLSRAYINMQEGYFSTDSDVGVSRVGSKVAFWHDPVGLANGDVLVNEIHKFVGSKGYVDEVVGSDDREVLVDKEVGSVGNYVLDYSLLKNAIEVEYDVSSGYLEVRRNVNGVDYVDKYDFIYGVGAKFIGTDSVDEYKVNDTFGGLEIDDSVGSGDIVDYSDLSSGVVANYGGSSGELLVSRDVDRVGRVEDRLKGVLSSNVVLTDFDDVVIDTRLKDGIDGLGGNNRLDLSGFVGGLSVDIESLSVSRFNPSGSTSAGVEYRNFSNIVLGNSVDEINFTATGGVRVDAGGSSNILRVVDSALGGHDSDYVKNIEIGAVGGYDRVIINTGRVDVVSEFKDISDYYLTNNNDRITIDSPQDLNGKTIDARGSTFVKGTLSYDKSVDGSTDGDTLSITGSVLGSGLDLFGGEFGGLTGFNSIVFDNGKFVGGVLINMDVSASDIAVTNESFRHIYGNELKAIAGSVGYTFNNVINNNTAGANNYSDTEYEIKGRDTVVTYGGVAGQEFYFRNFNKIVGAATADIFRVEADKDFNVIIDGGSGANELSYEGSKVGLYVSFESGNVSVYKDANSIDFASPSKSYDSYSGGLAKIVGGDGDDYFALDTLNVVFEIDGGAGDNFVSFANVNSAFTLSSTIDSSNYTRIKGFELTRQDDALRVDIAGGFSYSYDGGRGVDQILFNVDIAGGALTYTVNGAEASAMQGGYIRGLRNFEIYVGSNVVKTDFIINTYDNKNDYGDINTFFYLGGRNATSGMLDNTVSYTGVTEALEMFIGVGKQIYTGIGEEGSGEYTFATSVKKKSSAGNDAVDWFSRIRDYTLSSGNDRVNINVSSLVLPTGDIASIESIDMGGGVDMVDFSSSSANIAIDFVNDTVNGESGAWKFSNWEVLGLSDGDDSVVVSSELLGDSYDNGVYTIRGGEGFDSVSFAELTAGSFGGLTLDGTTGIVVDASGESTVDIFLNGSSDRLLNVVEFEGFEGSDFNDIFYGKATGSANYSKPAGEGTIDYSKATGLGINGFTFTINLNGSVINKNAISRFTDRVDSRFNKFVGTANGDTFVVNAARTGSIIDIDARGGANKLVLGNGITASAVNGLAFDLVAGSVYNNNAGTSVNTSTFALENPGTEIIKIKGINTISGTTLDDIFLANESLFSTSGGVLDGGAGVDRLYLASPAGADGYLLNTARSTITYKGSAEVRKPVVGLKGIQEVYFGDGDDAVTIGAGSAITSVDGGAGRNKVDLSNLLVAVTGNIGSLSVAGSGSITLTNFGNYALTNYNDIIEIDGDYEATSLDGNKGVNEVTYKSATDLSAIKLKLEAGYKGTITRAVAGGDKEDKLSNFSVYNIESGSDVEVDVRASADYYNIGIDVSNDVKITYADMAGVNLYVDLNNIVNVFKSSSTSLEGIDIYKSNTGGVLSNTDFTFVGSVGNDLYNLGAYTSTGVRSIEVAGNATSSSKTVYASGLATGGNGVDYVFGATSINVAGGVASYNITAGVSSSIGVVGLVGGSSGDDNFVFEAGSLGSIRDDGLKIDGLGGDDSLDFSAETVGAGESMVVDFVENKISFGLTAGDKTINLQNAIYNIASAAGVGDVEFKGLNEIREYNLDASNSTGSTKVSYNGAGGSVAISVNAGGNVSVNKGTVVDNLTGIKEYGATNFNDTIGIAAASLAALDASFDGGAGSDTLDISDYDGSSALTINLNATVNGVVWEDSGNRLDVKNVENLEVSGAKTGTEQVTLGVSNDIASSVVTTFKAGEAGDNQNAIYSYNNRKSDATVINVLLDGSTLDSNYTTALASVSSGGRVVSTTLYGVVDYRFNTGLLDTLNVSITDFDLANYNVAYSFNAGTTNGANNTLSLSGVLNVNEINFATASGVSGLSFINGGTTRAFNNFNNLEFSANYRGITNFTVGDYTRLNLDLANLSRANKITLNTGALIVANGLIGNNTVTYNNGALRYTEGANSIDVLLANGSGSGSLTASSTFLNIATAGATYAVEGNKPVNDMPRFVALNTGGSNVNFSGYTGTSNVFRINNVVADMGMHNAVYGAGVFDNNSRTNFTMQYGSTTIAGANNYVFSGGNDRVYFNSSSSNTSGGYVAPSITLNGGAGIDTLVLQPFSNTDLGLLSRHNNNQTFTNGAGTFNNSSVVITQDGIWKDARHTAIYKMVDGLNIDNVAPNGSSVRHFGQKVNFKANNFEALDLSSYNNILPLGKQLVVTIGDDVVFNEYDSNYWQEIIMPNRDPYAGKNYMESIYYGRNKANMYAGSLSGYDRETFLPANHVIFNHGSVQDINLTASFSFKANGNADYGYNLNGYYTTQAGVRTPFKASHVTNLDLLSAGTPDANKTKEIFLTFAPTNAAQVLAVVSSFNNGQLYVYNNADTNYTGGLNNFVFMPTVKFGGAASGKIANIDLSAIELPKVSNYTYNAGTGVLTPINTATRPDNAWIVDGIFSSSRFALPAIGFDGTFSGYDAFRQGLFNTFIDFDYNSLKTLKLPKGGIFLSAEDLFREQYGDAYMSAIGSGNIISGVNSSDHNDKLIITTESFITEPNNNKWATSGLEDWRHGSLNGKQYDVLFADRDGRSNYEVQPNWGDRTDRRFVSFDHLSVILMASGKQKPISGPVHFPDLQASGNHYITIGNKYNHETNTTSEKVGDVYLSNKVYIVAGIDNRFNGGGGGNPNGANHYLQLWNRGSDQDVADFSGIKNGDYAFMPTYAPKAMFNTVWQDATKFAVETDKTNARYNPVFSDVGKLNAVFDKNLNGGRQNLESIVAFGYNASAQDMSYLSESGSGVTSKTPLFYRLSGVEYIRGTDANDTFYMGKALGLSDAAREHYTAYNNRPINGDSVYDFYHPLFGLSRDANAQTNLATRLVEFYGAGGNNTLVNDMFTASHKAVYTASSAADASTKVPLRGNGLITMDNATVYKVSGDNASTLTLQTVRNGEGGNGTNYVNLVKTYEMAKFYGINSIISDDGVVEGDNTTYDYMQLRDINWHALAFRTDADYGVPSNASPTYKTGTKSHFNMDFNNINNYTSGKKLEVDLGGRYFRDADKFNSTTLVTNGGDYNGGSLGIQVGGFRQEAANGQTIAGGSAMYQQLTSGDRPSYVADDMIFDPNRYNMLLGDKSSNTNIRFASPSSPDVDIEFTADTTINPTSANSYTVTTTFKNVDLIYLDTGREGALGSEGTTVGNHVVNMYFNCNLDFDKLQGKSMMLFTDTRSRNNGDGLIWNKYVYDHYNYTYRTGGTQYLPFIVFENKLNPTQWFMVQGNGHDLSQNWRGVINETIANSSLPVTPRSASFVVRELLDTANTVQQSYNVLDDFYSVMGISSDYKEASALHTYNFNEIDKVYTNAQESEAKAEAEATSDTVVDVVKQDSSNVADVDVTEQDTTADGVEVAVKDATETEDVVVVEEPVDVALANVQNADVEADVEAENNAENNAETVTEEGTNAEGTNANAEGVEAEGEANTDAEVEVALSDDMDALLGDMLGFEANSSADNSFNLNGLSTNAVNSEEAEVDEDFSNTMNQLSQLEDTTTQQDEHESIAFALDSSVDVADDGSANQTEQAKVKNTVGVGD